MKNLKEIYKNNIIDTKEKIVSVNPFAEEPVFVDNLLSPKTKFEVSAAFNNRFSIDEEGMMDLIDMFELF